MPNCILIRATFLLRSGTVQILVKTVKRAGISYIFTSVTLVHTNYQGSISAELALFRSITATLRPTWSLCPFLHWFCLQAGPIWPPLGTCPLMTPFCSVFLKHHPATAFVSFILYVPWGDTHVDVPTSGLHFHRGAKASQASLSFCFTRVLTRGWGQVYY